MRDESDLSGLKLAIDLKRGADPDKLMAKLFKMTPLMDSYGCNFNILISGMPRVMGVREIIDEWVSWRTECVKRRVYFDLSRKKEKLHLLYGLKKILLDIDKAIAIIRNTESDAEVIPNLMIGFGIDEVQAEYIAEIKLRNINKEYILKRTEETEALEKEIADLEDLVNSRRRIHNLIAKELEAVIKKYGTDRRTAIVFSDEIETYTEAETVENYHVTLFLSRDGYFKKINDQSLRMNSEQKFKENDGLRVSFEAENVSELLIFTDRQQVYKVRASEFEDTKASALGTYLPQFLDIDENESIIDMVLLGDGRGDLLFFFENGKAARVPLSAYLTKTNRKKLTGAYSDKSPLVAIIPLPEELDLAVYASDGRALVFNSSSLAPKATRNTQGVAVMALKKKAILTGAKPLAQSAIANVSRYRVRSLPAAGALIRPEDAEEQQLSLEL